MQWLLCLYETFENRSFTSSAFQIDHELNRSKEMSWPRGLCLPWLCTL